MAILSEENLLLLRRHEGLRLVAYQDSVGVWTIGYGHTSGVQAGDAITREQAEDYLEEDLVRAFWDARDIFKNFDDLDQTRQDVLTMMAFNLGETRLRKFKRMIKAVHNKRFIIASLEMMASKWAIQVKQRAFKLASMMALGR